MKLNNRRVEGIYNMMEGIVWEVVHSITPPVKDMCLCSQCKTDIIAYALNRLPAFYVSSQEGEGRLIDQEMDERVRKIVILAMNHVAQYPHRVQRKMTEYAIKELFSYMDEINSNTE